MPDGAGAGLVIAVEPPDADDVVALLEVHLAFSAEVTPPGLVFALDLDGLRAPGVSFFTARRGSGPTTELVGVGALRHVEDGHVELKSMHVAEAARGTGAGRALVEHLVEVAAQQGYRRISIETGTYDAFIPARALYRSLGFAPCPPFGSYVDDPSSTCMTRVLDPAEPER